MIAVYRTDVALADLVGAAGGRGAELTEDAERYVLIVGGQTLGSKHGCQIAYLGADLPEVVETTRERAIRKLADAERGR